MNSSGAGRVHCPSLSFIQWRIQGRGPEGPAPLFLDQTKARRVEKNFLETCPPPPLSKGLDDRPPSPHLKVWIRHCYLLPKFLKYVAYAVTLCSHGRAEAGGHKLEHILLLRGH